MLKAAVVGCGYWGPNLVRNFVMSESVDLLKVADLREERLAAVKRVFPSVETTQDVGEVFSDPRVDLVAIATPVNTHRPLAEAALQANKHVLLEKPLASNAEDARALCELADKKGVQLFVDHTFLFTGAVRKLKQLIDAGEFGNIFYIDSVRFNLGLYQQDVSVIWDIAPHDLSILQYLLGGCPEKVSTFAVAHVSVDKSIYDLAYASFTYGSTIAHLSLSWLAPVKVRQMTIGGSKKMAVFDDLQNVMKVQVFDCGATPVFAESSEIVKVQWQYRRGDVYAPVLDGTEALKAEVDHIAECLRTGRRSEIIDGWKGYDVVRCLEAADASASSSGALVEIGPR
jgi:predicted dehydrogenase